MRNALSWFGTFCLVALTSTLLILVLVGFVQLVVFLLISFPQTLAITLFVGFLFGVLAKITDKIHYGE